MCDHDKGELDVTHVHNTYSGYSVFHVFGIFTIHLNI